MDFLLIALKQAITERIILLFIFLIITMFLDIVTGISKAVLGGDYKSFDLKRGILNKSLYLVIVILCLMVSILFPEVPITESAILLLFLVEVTSIIENLDKLGVPIPSFLKKIISNKKDELDDTTKDEEDEQ